MIRLFLFNDLHDIIDHLFIIRISLEFNKQDYTVFGSIQYLFECSDLFRIIREIRISQRQFLYFIQRHLLRFAFIRTQTGKVHIVIDDIVTVGSPLDIDLAAIGSVADRCLDTFYGVFWSLCSPGPMSDDPDIGLLNEDLIKICVQ